MKSTKYIVLSFLESLNREDFAAAYELLDKDMVFEGVLGSRHTADHYIADMKKMKFKYNIKEVMQSSITLIWEERRSLVRGGTRLKMNLSLK